MAILAEQQQAAMQSAMASSQAMYYPQQGGYGMTAAPYGAYQPGAVPMQYAPYPQQPPLPQQQFPMAYMPPY
eukprot:364214-Rhodomonas_salina.4